MKYTKRITAVPYFLMALLMVALAMFLAGCTSEGFKIGAAAIGPRLSAEASAYVGKDATIDAPTKSMRAAQADRLKTDTSIVANIDRATVEGDWATVKPWLLAYYNGNKKLGEIELKLRLADAAQMDKLLADEKARPFSK